jgi:hypothetical protein
MGRAKNRDSAVRENALLDLVRLDGMQTAKPAIEFGVFHDVEHGRVQDGMNDEQIQGIKVVVTEHFAGRTQPIGKRMARDGSDQIRGGGVILAGADH